MGADEPKRQDGGKNWYKLATLLLSLAMVALTFVSVVTYRSLDAQHREEKRIENVISLLQEQDAVLKLIPRIRVTLIAIGKSGLPSSAFEALAEVPAVLRLRHVSGNTAKSITVEVVSAAKIVRFLPERSVEQFSFEISPDKHSLRIEVDQLRRNSIVQGTIMCDSIGGLVHTAGIDVGVVEPEGDDPKKRMQRSLSLADLNKLNPSTIESTAEIEDIIEQLRRLQRRERDRGSSYNGSFMSDVILPVLIFGSFWLALSAAIFYFPGKRQHELGNRIGRSMALGLIKNGMSESEVQGILGPPRTCTTSIDGEHSSSRRWEYGPRPSWFHSRDRFSLRCWEPDLNIDWKDGKVAHVEYKTYGIREFS